MAESELRVVSRPCLTERMKHREHLQRDVAAWQAQPDAHAVRVEWRFTTKLRPRQA
jgi:hypothetical protein